MQISDSNFYLPNGQFLYSSLVSLSFILILGSLVDRAYLLCDSMIAEKVSLTGLLFLAGLYVSSLSSTVGSLLGTPRVIQSIASEGIIPLLNPLAHGVIFFNTFI